MSTELYDLSAMSIREIEDAVSAKLGGEPVFLLRAQDYMAAGLIANWAVTGALIGVPAEKVARAFAKSKDFQRWPTKKVPD